MAREEVLVDSNSEKLQGHLDPGAAELETVNNDQVYNIDPEEERQVVRRLDCVIMPLMALVYFFQCKFSRLSGLIIHRRF